MRARVARRLVVGLLAVAVVVGVLPVQLVAPGSAPRGVTSAEAQTTTKTFGAEPLADVLYWADQKKACGLSRDQLAAMMMSPTFNETGAPATVSPSPMTLSRWDNQTSLYAYASKTQYPRAFFHPGVGMWQFDSAGGWPLTGATAINSYTSAQQAATVIASRWCVNPTWAYALAPWYYCGTTTICQDNYRAVFNGTSLTVRSDPTTTRYGGMQQRSCTVAGLGAVTCWFVDPSQAQGHDVFNLPNFGPAPISAPFYVVESGGREYRYWLKQDTGYGVSISADKPVTANARSALTWRSGEVLCDVTASKGDTCATLRSAPVVARNADGRQEVFVIGPDGRVRHSWQLAPNGSWSTWRVLGGSLSGGLSVITSADGRLELFGRGTDGTVQHSWQGSPGGLWSTWTSRGGSWPATSEPVGGVNADGRLEIFVQGSDGAVYQSWQLWPSGPWSAWYSMGGSWPVGAHVAVGRNGDGRQEVYVVGADRALYHRYQVAPNKAWAPWSSLGGSLAGPVTVGYSTDRRQELFAVGADGAMWHLWQRTVNGGWSTFTSRGGSWPPSAEPVSARNADGRLEVFATAAGGTVWHAWQGTVNGSFVPFAALGGSAVGRPGLGMNADGRLEVFVTEPDQEVAHAWQVKANGAWSGWLGMGFPAP
ncbi:MAG: hypothetical protein MUF83_12510 [Acidimicrobiales bacterium]|jgi:hypothetical protein|nr:hypothetical protein [Acidimicrobiales bacterium]